MLLVRLSIFVENMTMERFISFFTRLEGGGSRGKTMKERNEGKTGGGGDGEILT